MSVLGIVPARMASTRFPGKPMAEIHGVPMVGHCLFRSLMADGMDEVYVATCDTEIDAYVKSLGRGCVMTSPDHERASDRAAEALTLVEQETGRFFDHVALIQGDEPMLVPDMLDELVAPVLADPSLPVVNLVADITSEEEFADPNTVKVVAGVSGDALYFSREPIPSRKKYDGDIPRLKQLGMILFSRDALMTYPRLVPTPLEIIESVDMNRFLEHGWPIRLVRTAHASHAVDTPQDLERVGALMEGDPLMQRYGEERARGRS